MNAEQILLEKWRVLSPEKQQEILDLLDRVYQQEIQERAASTYQPKTELGKKLWEIRLKSLGTQPLLKSWEEVEQELDQRRGGIRE